MTEKLLLIFCTVVLLPGLFSCKRQTNYANALVNETSPYLLQHANNPVNWYPWGEEALEKAQSENKLLIISVGYSACHWCHVMEHESFEDTAVANLMNAHFVSIKVDREERPDIDAIYMDACQLATGQACGWPLNVFALPDGRPVWAGTYFRKKNWQEILGYFVDLQQKEPDKLDEYADRLLSGMQQWNEIPGTDVVQELQSLASLQSSIDSLKSIIDPVRGGFRGAPKFPMPNVQELLMEWYFYTQDSVALRLLETTLQNLAAGGIYDQLGGGFARYSTDNLWQVPHFEKMLYDNAQLVSLYAQAFALTGKNEYAEVVRETLNFIHHHLTDDSGGFYASLDADSEGVEGKYYVWTKEELDALLPDNKVRPLFFEYYQITTEGNWEEGKNIFFRKEELKTFAAKHKWPLAELHEAFSEFERILLSARDKRILPGLDDKILTSWNALTMKAYVDAYRYLGSGEYLEMALENAHFIQENLLESDGRLFRTFKDGSARVNAFLDDYALMAQAWISLYEVTFDERWLKLAQNLTDYAIIHFQHESSPFFYYTSDEDPKLITRTVELRDNVIPASNSVMAEVLFDLSLYFYEDKYRKQAEAMLAYVRQQWKVPRDATEYTNWLQLSLKLVDPPFEVAIVGPDYANIQKQMMQTYLPNGLFLGGAAEGGLELLKDKLKGSETFIYVCKNKACQLPVQEVEVAFQQMDYRSSTSSSSKIR